MGFHFIDPSCREFILITLSLRIFRSFSKKKLSFKLSHKVLIPALLWLSLNPRLIFLLSLNVNFQFRLCHKHHFSQMCHELQQHDLQGNNTYHFFDILASNHIYKKIDNNSWEFWTIYYNWNFLIIWKTRLNMQ